MSIYEGQYDKPEYEPYSPPLKFDIHISEDKLCIDKDILEKGGYRDTESYLMFKLQAACNRIDELQIALERLMEKNK